MPYQHDLTALQHDMTITYKSLITSYNYNDSTRRYDSRQDSIGFVHSVGAGTLCVSLFARGSSFSGLRITCIGR